MRLLILDNEGIVEWLDQFDKESKAIKKDLIKMCWFMRGGLTYDEAVNLSIEERNIVAEIVSENLETTKKSGMPFF
jgi:glutamate formiminotransferase